MTKFANKLHDSTMFGFNSSKSQWEKMAQGSNDYYFKEGVRELLIPYKISPKKVAINLNCMEIGNSYSYDYCSGCSLSMHDWVMTPPWDRPKGFTEWFIAAFPDVASWIQTRDGSEYLNSLFGTVPENQLVDLSVGKIRIFYLKKIIDAYLEKKRLPLETVG